MTMQPLAVVSLAAVFTLAFSNPALAERNVHRPVFSPDGSRIIFMSMSEQTGGDWELYLMDSDGRNLKRLTNHKGWDGYAVWSPDGSRIIFDRGDADGEKKRPFFLDLATGNLQPLGAYEGWLSISDWSNDGNTLLGFHETGGQRDLVLVNLDGSIARRLTGTPNQSEHDAHFSRDDTRVVFANGSVDGSGTSLEMLVLATEQRGIVHTSEGRIYGLSWSPAGTMIAYTDAPGGSEDDADIFLVTPGTSIVTQLTDDPAWDHMPVWHPDGRLLLFTSYRSGEERVYSLDPSSRHVLRVWAGDSD